MGLTNDLNDALHSEGLVKSYGGRKVVNDVSFYIKREKFWSSGSKWCRQNHKLLCNRRVGSAR